MSNTQSRRDVLAGDAIALDCASGERRPSCGPGLGLIRDDDIGPVRRRALPHGERFCYKKAYGEKLARGTSEFSMPKQAGELCHAKALFHRQASEQSLTRLRVCRHVSLDSERCVRLN